MAAAAAPNTISNKRTLGVVGLVDQSMFFNYLIKSSRFYVIGGKSGVGWKLGKFWYLGKNLKLITVPTHMIACIFFSRLGRLC